MDTRTKAVKAIMNNKGVGLPEAIRLYNAMTAAQREKEIATAKKCGVRF